ncbi:MAG: alanine racemase [Xanthomonadales bacterium]|nr:alanine racemase [Xanthomonadales bacterium]
MQFRTLARIDLSALAHNISVIAKLAPQSQLMAVVKANAYGHGLASVTPVLTAALAAADAAGVATLEEATTLRANGWQGRLMLLQGFANAQELDAAIELETEVVVHQHAQLELLAARADSFKQRVWVKLETGMNRLGFPADQLNAILQQLQQYTLGLMTHFAAADETDNPSVLAQISRFEAAVSEIDLPKTLANSAATINYPQAHADMVRCGLMLFGVSPLAQGCGADLGLRPVMRFSSRLLAVKKCQAGDLIGYNGTYSCPENMPIGVVAIGYGDGYPYLVSNRTGDKPAMLMLKGVKCPVVGRVSMDMLAIDLRPLETLGVQAEQGEEVILWGPELPVENLARSIGSIPYELLCGLTGRVNYQYHEDGAS